MSGYFQKQLKAFGMTPSFAFVREPETNGVAERFIRTLKEQIVFGRIYQDIEVVRAAVRAAGKERLPKPGRDQAEGTPGSAAAFPHASERSSFRTARLHGHQPQRLGFRGQ